METSGLRVVGDSKLADLAYQYFRVELEKYKQEILAKIMNNYKSGKTDAVTVSSAAAELCVLQEIEGRILRSIQRGRSVEEKLFKKGVELEQG